jgi:hypothetical protein
MVVSCRAFIAAVAACAAAGCSVGGDDPTATSPPSTDATPVPIVVTVQLDVSGPGLSVITHSTSSGATVITDRVVLQNWSTRYQTDPKMPILLSVAPTPLGPVRCAVHVDGRLVADDSSRTPNCSVTGV